MFEKWGRVEKRSFNEGTKFFMENSEKHIVALFLFYKLFLLMGGE